MNKYTMLDYINKDIKCIVNSGRTITRYGSDAEKEIVDIHLLPMLDRLKIRYVRVVVKDLIRIEIL